MKVKDVKYLQGYSILVSFEDGTNGIIQLNDLVEKGVFRELQDQTKFSKVYTTGYSIAWSDQLEIDAASIYAEISGKEPAVFYNSLLANASN